MATVTNIKQEHEKSKYLKMLRDLYRSNLSMTYQGDELLILKKIKGREDQVLWLNQDEIQQVIEFLKCQQKRS